MDSASDGLARDEIVCTGVSVVVPSYRDFEDALPALESLARQTLPTDRFEVLLVLNGRSMDRVAQASSFRNLHRGLRLRVIATEVAGVSYALNLGIQAASMPWVTFVDDDDTVSDGFLAGLMSMARPGVIPLSRVDDVGPDGDIQPENRLNEQILPLQGMIVPVEDCSRALTFNTAKMLPTDWARAVLHDVELASGHDVAFYGEFHARFDFSWGVVGPDEDCTYFRRLSENSQSRQDESYAFSVTERLRTMERIDRVRKRSDEPKWPLLGFLMSGQASFIARYLEAHPDRFSQVREDIIARGFEGFPWTEALPQPETLVISACFPPYIDPSSVTVAKRISVGGRPVDVVTADMSSVRRSDASLARVLDGYVRRIHTIPAVGFSSWESMEAFAERGWDVLAERAGEVWPYTTVYSRAMWPASHVLGAYVKLERPTVQWIAEFSDPLSRNVEGQERPGPEPSGALSARFMDAIEERFGADLPASATVFETSEWIAYAFADRLVFTNEHQRAYMIESCRVPELARRVESIAEISPQPPPPAEWIAVAEAALETEVRLADDRVNLAYFGSFYANRSLDVVLGAIASLPFETRSRLALHVYSDNEADVLKSVGVHGAFDVVEYRPSLPYLEFLAVARSYDVLVVNDVSSQGTHPVNPYLPSKVSDYVGVKRPIWKICEAGSPLSAIATDFTSLVLDEDGTRRVLADIVSRMWQASETTGRGAEPANVGKTHV